MRLYYAALLLPAALLILPAASEGPAGALRLESRAAVLRVDLQGGVLAEFHRAGDRLNPLAGMGHFLCLDRWGPPSAAEEKLGMPFHGEASKVRWRVTQGPVHRNGGVEAEMEAALPLAGLEVRRTLRLAGDAAILSVREAVTNRNPLGRIYNMVQHPTIGPPFLDGDTRVDAGAGRGFMQGNPLPHPEAPQVRWPYALLEGRRVDLRRLTDNPNPNVVSYEALGAYGWTTAVAPGRGLLIGYVWPTRDYPWFNAWRHVENGKPALRGLEFGTTGLHQPFAVLVRKGRIFGLPLYAYLDAGETVERCYSLLLAAIPHGFEGVETLTRSDGRFTLRERGGARRTVVVEASLPADRR